MRTMEVPSAQLFFTRSGLFSSQESITCGEVVRRDFFQKTTEDDVICFTVTSQMLPDGQIVPVVEHPDFLPLLDEVIDALKAQNV
jgi:hypothetical protein